MSQAPTKVLIALARLHQASDELQNALTTEIEEARKEYMRLSVLADGVSDPMAAALLEITDERSYLARRALRIAFGGFAGQIVLPQPEDLGYDKIRSIG